MSAPEHGTYAGWNAHKRKDEPPCEDCRMAQREYVRDWRHDGILPKTLPDERFSNLAGGVGLAYAYAMRESA